MSFLSRAFSSPFLKGDFYPDEKPEVALDLKGSKQEQKRLASLINRIAKSSPLGKSVLEDAAKAGYSLSFEFQLYSYGYCVSKDDEKTIVLSPRFSDKKLISALAHEGRHAQQHANGVDNDFGKRNVKSELMYYRAMEADAETVSAATCFEMSQKGDADPWTDFRWSKPHIAEPFEYGSKDRISDDTLQESFRGWFRNDSMKTMYERAYLLAPMENAMLECKEKDMPYDKDVSSAEVLKLFCRKEDKKSCYFQDNLTALDGRMMTDLSNATVQHADRFFSVRKMRTGQEPDDSYKTLRVRDNIQAAPAQNQAPMLMNNGFFALKAQKSR